MCWLPRLPSAGQLPANPLACAHRWWGFPLSCPPDSRLQRAYDGLETDTLPRGPSYIADHLQTMNMCDNPEWQYLHGESRLASSLSRERPEC